MTTSEILTAALAILKGHDFYWIMDDFAYTNGTCSDAKANMREYVKTIKQLPSDLYELMRSLWIAQYNYCGCFRPFWISDKAPQYKEETEKLMAEVECILSTMNIAA